MVLNVMLVEDQSLLRLGIELALSSTSEISIVCKAENGKQAVEMYTSSPTDVVLMDIKMPILDGLAASRAIRNFDKNAKIIFLTNNESIADVFEAFSIGASGYCLKDIDAKMLIQHIQTAASGGLAIDSRIAENILRYLMSKQAMPDQKSTQPFTSKLTNKDAQVLNQLVNGAISENALTIDTKLSIINILSKVCALSPLSSISPNFVDIGEDSLSRSYEFLQVLGKGGMGTVFKARKKDSGQVFAVKMLSYDSSQFAIERFVREAAVLSKLSHRSIVGVHDFHIDSEGFACIVMEFADGPNLSDVLDCGGAIIEKEAVPIFWQCAEALLYVHSAGVIHRDIKPSNIILCNEENILVPKIVDFGLAKNKNPLGADERLTLQGEIFGSPLYMSPEQIRGGATTESTDIYSLGCVMFEVLTGVPPFMGSSPTDTMAMHLRDPVPNLSALVSRKLSISEPLQQVIEKCLAKDPEDRFPCAKSLASELCHINALLSRALV